MYSIFRNSKELVKLAQWATSRTFSRAPTCSAMKPGSPIPGLSFLKGTDPVVALERKEYPDWINDLAKPKISLAKLRRMPESEATDREKMRYLKLERRLKIKVNNVAAEGQ